MDKNYAHLPLEHPGSFLFVKYSSPMKILACIGTLSEIIRLKLHGMHKNDIIIVLDQEEYTIAMLEGCHSSGSGNVGIGNVINSIFRLVFYFTLFFNDSWINGNRLGTVVRFVNTN